MIRYVLSLVIALGLASFASAQCNVRSSADTASAAAAVQNAQIQALISQLAVQPQAATSAVATAGTVAPQAAQLAQIQALLAAQQRAATASALAAPAVQVAPVCSGGSCGVSRARSAVRTLSRPVIVRPQRSRSVARSVTRT